MRFIYVFVTFAAASLSSASPSLQMERSQPNNMAGHFPDLDAMGVCPPPKKCYYAGTAPTCDDGCKRGETRCMLSKTGCGDTCEQGWKVLCCEGECPG